MRHDELSTHAHALHWLTIVNMFSVYPMGLVSRTSEGQIGSEVVQLFPCALLTPALSMS